MVGFPDAALFCLRPMSFLSHGAEKLSVFGPERAVNVGQFERMTSRHRQVLAHFFDNLAVNLRAHIFLNRDPLKATGAQLCDVRRRNSLTWF